MSDVDKFVLKFGNGAVKVYSEWAATYDKDLDGDAYRGHIAVGQASSKYLGDYYEARILDVASGTGKLGVELQKLGYKNVEAVDACEEMNKIAARKGVYKKIFTAFLSDQETEMKAGHYDLVAVSGGFADNHLPCSSLLEIIRVTKPGGLVIMGINCRFLEGSEQYVDKLEPYMAELEAQGKWKRIERSVIPKYIKGYQGALVVYKVI